MLQWIVLVFSGFFLYSLNGQAEPRVDLKLEIQSDAIVVEQKITGWQNEAREFTLNSKYEILQATPAFESQKALNPETKLFVFPVSQTYQLKYRIPLNFAQSSQVSFYQEQSWYLNPTQGVPAIYQLHWSNATADTTMHLVHSAVPTMQEGISALLGHFRKYEKVAASGVRLQIYLIQQDDALAETILNPLLKYLAQYESMIGPYPYENFAVVENVDPTGYAFPTMTWIGSQILRFPFILTTSLPHELLHSWWGNGVFVDTSFGNWCEGLTTYLADYFYQPSEAAKKDYRLKQLLEYENYTKSGAEISLMEFRSRGEDRSLQAVGYGKSLFVFLMLENQMGEKKFHEVLKKFYSDFRGRQASFRDFFQVANQVSGQDLTEFFNVWIQQKGSMDLTFLQHSKVQKSSVISIESLLKPDFHQVSGLQIPVSVKSKSSASAVSFFAPIRDQKISIELKEEPAYIWFDPDFKLFRKLKAQEKPNVLSEILGEEKLFYTALGKRPVDQAVQAEILKIEKKQFESLSESKIDFSKKQTLIVFGSFNDIFVAQSEARLQIQKVLNERGVRQKQNGQIEVQGGVFNIAGNALILALPVENSTVLLLLTNDELNGTRIVQRMLRYGAQSFVLLGPTSAVTQGLWQGLESELKVKF